MYLIPLLATLMSSVFSAGLPLVSRNLGHRGVAVFSITSLVIAFISSACIWVDLYIGSSPVWLDLFGPWFEVGTVTVSWIFYYDLLTAHMLFTVTSVSLAVHIFAVVYMRSDPHLSLFMSYLSLFTFFMLVYVCGDNLLVMLVGWEGKITPCLSDTYVILIVSRNIGIHPFLGWIHNPLTNINLTRVSLCESTEHVHRYVRTFYTSHIPADLRIGPHSKLFNEILVGFLLGDGWLEKHGKGARLGVSLIEKFKDVADWYQKTLYFLGYMANDALPLKPSIRGIRDINASPYYQLRTFTFKSFLPFYDDWYKICPKTNKRIKVVPVNIQLTPIILAIWAMADGSGTYHGSFRLASHSFSKEENLMLCELLYKTYSIKATIHHEKAKNLYYIYIWKQSTPLFKSIINPYIKDSCQYKFRFVKQSQ